MTTTSRPPGQPPVTTPAAPAADSHAAAVRRLPWAWPIAILVGFPIGDAMRQASVYGGAGLADYGGSSWVLKVGLDWQPGFMRR